MYWSWDLNLTNQIRKFIVTTCILCMSFFSFPQSPAHSGPIVPATGLSYLEMPDLPEINSLSIDKSNGFCFAYPFQVSVSLKDIAFENQQDTLFYHIDIVSKNAYSLNLIFENIDVPDGSILKIYGTDSTINQIYLSSDLNQTGVLPTVIVKGEKICVRYCEPVNSAKKGKWTITQVSHDFTNIFLKESELKALAASCNVDINCSSEGNTWQKEKRAVCKLVVQGITMCTGTLVNNTSRDNTPYVLTANHCISNSNKALRTVFYFNYERDCETSQIAESNSISGSTLIATSPDGKVDFSLVKMNQTPTKSFDPYYAGWNLQDNSLGKGTVCIHHPKGDVKKISVDKDKPATTTFKTKSMTYAPDAHWEIARWEVGTTEAGSSGSSLFDSNHLVMGTLSGGAATCETPEKDYFSKFSKAWNYYDASTAQLKPWLDPLNLGVEKCQGFDPYELQPNVMTNILTSDELHLFDFDTVTDGTWSGVNQLGWNAVAERFVASKYITDIAICGKINLSQNTDDVIFSIWTGSQKPETEVFSIPMTEVSIQDSVWVYLPLEKPISVKGVFWIGYRIRNKSTAFCAYLSETESDGDLFVKHPKGWVLTDSIGFPAHMGILIHTSENQDTVSSLFFEKPFFANSISNTTISKVTPELFSVDTLSVVTNNMRFYKVSSKNVSNWAGENELGMSCFANKMSLTHPEYVRGVNIAVAENPNSDNYTYLIAWNSDFSKELCRKIISNKELEVNKFNLINFDTLLYVDSEFAYGVCYENNTKGNISLYQYYDVESDVDGYFYLDNSWAPYQKYGIPYNVGLVPIVAKSKYHYNPDSANIIRTPLKWQLTQKIVDAVSCYVYPTICSTHINIQFLYDVPTCVDIEIIDSKGGICKQEMVGLTNGKITVSLNDLPSGIFSLKLTCSSGEYVQKIIHLQ